MKKIFMAAGGTGGHFFAAVAVGEELINRGYEVHLGTDSRCKKYISSDFKLISHIVDLQRYPDQILLKIRFFIDLYMVIYRSIKLLITIKPEIIVGFGGYPVLPIMIAGFLLRIPIVVHEQNCIVGKVNRLCSKFAKKIALSYEETENLSIFQKKKIVITGGIIRASIRNLPIKKDFDNEIFRIFIFGGSQGAKIFSELIPDSIKVLMTQNPKLKLHVTQQVAREDQQRIKEFYSNLKISSEVKEFFDDIADKYKNSDIVISRAGASTIWELTHIGLPAIFIPLPSASENHQLYNAKILENARAGWCFEQNRASAIKIAYEILAIIENRDILKQASYNLLKRKKEGYKILADVVENIIT